MTPDERSVLKELTRQISATIDSTRRSSWHERTGAATELFRTIHSAWWRRHVANPSAYPAEIARINEVLGLRTEEGQLAHLAGNPRRLLPPKFFGGDTRKLSQDFVLSFTLNHAAPESSAFAAEVDDFQREDTCWSSHLSYFQKDYAHWRFFVPRGKVLAACARALGQAVPPAWQDQNERYALYLETLPTFSRTFRTVIAEASWGQLRELFVIALNDLARRVAVELLQPRRALLAGQGSWDCLPSSNGRQAHPMGLGLSTDAIVLPGASTSMRVVRCNFIGRSGPNSATELGRLGRILASDAAADDPSCGSACRGLTRVRMMELVNSHGLALLEKSWTHVVSGPRHTVGGGRILAFTKGDVVRDIHLRRHTEAPDPLFVREGVLYRLRPPQHETADVERAVSAALAAL